MLEDSETKNRFHLARTLPRPCTVTYGPAKSTAQLVNGFMVGSNGILGKGAIHFAINTLQPDFERHCHELHLLIICDVNDDFFLLTLYT